MRAYLPLALAVLLMVPAVSAQTQNGVFWGVRRHVDTLFNETDLDDAMEDANRKVRIDNERCNDRPCQLTFYVLDGLGLFGFSGDGRDEIDNETELDAVMEVSGRVKVVTSISYCNGVNESTIGCGRCDGIGFVVESGVSGDVYVHEFGHNVMGCGHREDCEHNIMDNDTDGTNNALSDSECTGLTGITAHEWCGEMVMLTEPEWFHWVTCPIYLPTGELYVTKPFDEWQFRQGMTVTSHGDFQTPAGGPIHMYSNSEDRALPGLKIYDEPGWMRIRNGGQIRFE